MSKYFHRLAITAGTHLVISAFVFGTLFFGVNPAHAQKMPWDAAKRTVVLDPGHGGHDTGARGTDGTREKAVTLALARLLAAELEGACRVVLSRTDDYFIDIPERTAVANREKADLFVSLHTGGSFTHTVNAVHILYFNALSIPDLTPQKMDTKPLKNRLKGEGVWRRIQLRHIQNSQLAAKFLHRSLDVEDSTDVRISGAPMLVLEGADMPAILVEIGYLTHPSEERKLSDMDALTDLAKKMGMGILNFLEEKTTQSEIDLNSD